MTTLTVDGMDRLVAALKDFSRFRKDFRGKLPRVVLRAQKSYVTDRLRNTKHGPDGESWAPWSDAYAKTRKGSDSLLISERKLVNSFRAVVSAGKGELGSPLPYAAAHHFGVPGRNLPARPYFGMGSDDISKLDDVINTWVRSSWP
jgi:phage virion morphogenesis protein